MPAAYKGTLKSKRKNELVEIANSLGLQIDEDAAKRDDVEILVKNHLVNNRSALQSNAAFTGLYTSIDQSDKRAARSSSISAVLPSFDGGDASDDGRKHSQKGRLTNGIATPLRRTSTVANQGASNIASALTSKARQSIEDLGSKFRSGAAEIRSEVRDEIGDVSAEVNSFTSNIRRSARRSFSKVEKQSNAVFVKARNFFSNAEHLTALFVILEAFILVSQIMPFTNVKVGQNNIKSFVKQAAGKSNVQAHLPRLTLAVPNLWVLLTYQFWRPILLWSGWTVGIPFLAANLITFDRKHEPSPLTFNLVRLALLSGLSKHSFFAAHAVPQVVGVAAGEVKQVTASFVGSIFDYILALVNYSFVTPFISIELQILGTALAVGFAAYEVTATRSR